MLSQREILWKKRKLLKDENEKHRTAEKISSINDKLSELRKGVMLCEDIETRIPKINKNLDELDTQEELEKKSKDKQKEKNK